MKFRMTILCVALLVSMSLLPPVQAQSTTFTILHSFSGKDADGRDPNYLIQGRDGNFYGTTGAGRETVFKMTPSGTLTTLGEFNGSVPERLVQGADGNFYGTTYGGGVNNGGTVFKISASGELTTLVSFQGVHDAHPSSLLQGADGNFYGTTGGGGVSSISGEGTVFKMTPSGTLTTLVSFTGDNGSVPERMVQGADGNFYGTTLCGGAYRDEQGLGCGTIFKMTASGELTTLVSFHGANDAHPSTLVQGRDGSFYGTTCNINAGKVFGYSTIFRMTASGELTTLVSFHGAGNHLPDAPDALIFGSDGNFYGTIKVDDSSLNEGKDSGRIFKMTASGKLTTVVLFNGNNGYTPDALILGNDDNLYGVSHFGGNLSPNNPYGHGMIFKVSLQQQKVDYDQKPTTPLTPNTVPTYSSNPTSDQSPQLQEVVKLTQAKMSDDVVLAFIKSSGASYNLSASDILYLNNQGVSQPVISALLTARPSTP